MNSRSYKSRPKTSIREIAGQTVGSIALGTGLMALLNTPEGEAIDAIHAALDADVRVFDAAAAYTPTLEALGYSDRLVTRAVATWNGPRDEVIHVSKGGHRRVGNGLNPEDFVIDATPESIRKDAESSLKAMNASAIDLYLLHMPDPAVPLVESYGALLDLKREGKVRMVGLSNVNLAQIQEVIGEGPVDAVENQYSLLPDRFGEGWPMTRDDSTEVVRWCESTGALFLGYGPLGGGTQVAQLAARLPAFQEVATRRAVSVQQVALAWLLRQSDRLIPIAGCRRVQTAVDSAGAMYLELDPEELSRLNEQAKNPSEVRQ